MLAGLWVAGRVVMLVPTPPLLRALVDLAFIPALAVVLARPIVGARNRRNYVFLAMLSVLAATNVGFHLDLLGALPGWRRVSSIVAVDVIVLMIVVIGGRVIPMFTRNATGALGDSECAEVGRGCCPVGGCRSCDRCHQRRRIGSPRGRRDRCVLLFPAGPDVGKLGSSTRSDVVGPARGLRIRSHRIVAEGRGQRRRASTR